MNEQIFPYYVLQIVQTYSSLCEPLSLPLRGHRVVSVVAIQVQLVAVSLDYFGIGGKEASEAVTGQSEHPNNRILVLEV